MDSTTDKTYQADTRYPERLVVLLPRGSKAALDSAARKQHTTMSELARQLLLETSLARGSIMRQLCRPSRANMHSQSSLRRG
jgi:hypothetical protein